MASSRDDFIIAIRSAFLRKSTKQKFSLLTLTFLSIFIIILSNLNFQLIKKFRGAINEVIYRSSFIISLPENFIVNSYYNIEDYSNFYKKYKEEKLELEKLKSQNISSEIIISENKELKELIEDYTLTTNKILAKVIVDHTSPFLRTIIINKGSTDKIKIGTNVYDKNYLVGRVIEVNYKSSRVLLLSDLNSSVPISITPGNIQAIIVGNGDNSAEIQYVKDNLIEDIEDKGIAYTSGTGSIFKSGIPVGRINTNKETIIVNFYSDFTQLKYVFAEVEQGDKISIISKTQDEEILNEDGSSQKGSNTEKIKINILTEQVSILRESNSKFVEENQVLRSEINEKNNKIFELNNKTDSLSKKINQNKIDQNELEFLRLNLIYSSKCQKRNFRKGFKVGTEEYKNCIISKGKLND